MKTINHKPRLNQLEKAIIATLAYAEVKKWPLTFWEIFRYLINPKRTVVGEEHFNYKQVNLKDIFSALEYLDKQKIIEGKNGFYFLKEANIAEEILRKRIRQDKIADKKIKKVIKIIQYLKIFPWTKGFFLSGSLVFGWPREESDIDLLIIVKTGHIWTVRFLLTGFLFLFRLKRSSKNIKDRICLNHFISDKSLKIPLYSLYNAATYVRFVPLYIDEKNLAGFFEQNYWVNDYFVWGYGKYISDLRQQTKAFSKNMFKNILELLFLITGLGLLFETILSNFQIHRVKKDPSIYKKGGRVVVDNAQIEFHPQSPEKKILSNYNNILKNLNLFCFKREKDSGLT
jgi:predicted nucleotidyltransferase